MKTVTEETLQRLLSKWLPLEKPEFRLSKCWSCGEELEGPIWHVPFTAHPTDCHLCETCFEELAV